jgi:DNA-binding response OmpR family regulator
MGTVLDKTICVGYLEIEPRAYRATLRGRLLPLTPSQVELLSLLAVNRDRVVTRAEFAGAAGLEGRTVDVVLSSLRRMLGDDFVRNVRNRGWILEPTAFER